MSDQPVVQASNNKKIFLGIIGIPVLVILLSTVLYFLVESRSIDLGTVNNGELISPPLEFGQLSLKGVDGKAFDYSKPEPKWSFIVIGDQHCSDVCEQMLYIARQSIVATGKKMARLRMIYVSSDGMISSQLQQRFAQEYIGLQVLAMTYAELDSLFKGSTTDPFASNQFLVADPRGWLMMAYKVDAVDQETLNTLGKAVVRDMKRLIK